MDDIKTKPLKIKSFLPSNFVTIKICVVIRLPEDTTRVSGIQFQLFLSAYNKAAFKYMCCTICCSCAGMSQYQYMNAISTSINNKSIILVKCLLYNFVPRGVSIFENTKTTVGNQTVIFKRPLASFLKRKTWLCISPCK